MTSEQLLALPKKQLIEMARKRGISGWHDMRKDELAEALQDTPTKPARISRSGRESGSSRGENGKNHGPAPVETPTPSRSLPPRTELSSPVPPAPPQPTPPLPPKPTATAPRDLPTGYRKDRITVMVRDPFWLHCYWELTRQALQRAEAALNQEWHSARPILRLLDVNSTETSCTTETTIRDILIHGGCNNWYIDVKDPPRTYRVDIGYLARSGRFYILARSNVVTTPRPGTSDVIDENWSDIDASAAERIYAMSAGFDANVPNLELKQLFEERLRRPLGSPTINTFGGSGFGFSRGRKFWFDLDADLIIYGASEPNARVTIQGQPVPLRPDGTFTIRFKLPDSRQIIPAVATSPDGMEERTIVLAVERNTKQLEPTLHDTGE